MATIEERLAVLEEQYKHVSSQMDTIVKQNTAIVTTLSKQKGFIGGVITAVSAVWALVLAVMSYFRHG